MSRTWLSHLRGSGLNPGQSTKTLLPTWLEDGQVRKEYGFWPLNGGRLGIGAPQLCLSSWCSCPRRFGALVRFSLFHSSPWNHELKSEKANYVELWWKLTTKAVSLELNSGYKCWPRKRLVLVFRWLAWNRFLVSYNKAEWRRLLAWPQFSNSQMKRHIRRGLEQRSSCPRGVWGPAQWIISHL